MSAPSPRFWERKPLGELGDEEWEALCDGCGRCCLHKLEDEHDGGIHYTRVACHLLDLDTCSCGDYPNRRQRVPDCISLRGAPPETFDWLPQTCAYRRLAHGQRLPAWHPLNTGDPLSVHLAGISVRGWAISENQVPEDANPEDYLLDG
jgi:uncharacterized cysteine cluster protein YcgN (CxxCxxCC family)